MPHNNNFLRQRIRLDAISILRALRGRVKYSEISEVTGIPASIISNYVNGKIIPSVGKAEEVLRLTGVREIYRRLLCNQAVDLHDPDIVTFASWHIVNELCMGRVVNRVGILSYRVYGIGFKISEIIGQPIVMMVTGRVRKGAIGRGDRLLVLGEVFSEEKARRAVNIASRFRAKISMLVFLRGRVRGERDPGSLIVLCGR